MIKLSIIIVNYRTPEYTNACIKSLMDGLPLFSEIVVVDNASEDGSLEKIHAAHPEVRVIASTTNDGFAGGCKLGVEASNGELVGFINSDCIAEAGALQILVNFLEQNKDVSLVVPRLLDSDGSVQNNVAKLPSLRHIANEYLLGRMTGWYPGLGRWSEPTEVESCSGAALVIRKSDYIQAGGFPTRYFMYVEDVELCLQLHKLGKQIIYLPNAVLTHHGGGSSQGDRSRLNKILQYNRIDYVKRNFSPIISTLAWCTIYTGLAIMTIKYGIKRLYHRRYSRQK